MHHESQWLGSQKEDGYKGEENKDKMDPVRMDRSQSQCLQSSKAGVLCHQSVWKTLGTVKMNPTK